MGTAIKAPPPPARAPLQEVSTAAAAAAFNVPPSPFSAPFSPFYAPASCTRSPFHPSSSHPSLGLGSSPQPSMLRQESFSSLLRSMSDSDTFLVNREESDLSSWVDRFSLPDTPQQPLSRVPSWGDVLPTAGGAAAGAENSAPHGFNQGWDEICETQLPAASFQVVMGGAIAAR